MGNEQAPNIEPGKGRLVYDKERRTIVAQTPYWQPIATAPTDGTRFLAWGTVTADEYDEDDHIIRRGVVEKDIYVAYSPFGGRDFVSFPWRGSVPGNLKFTHWRPLPAPPAQTEG